MEFSTAAFAFSISQLLGGHLRSADALQERTAAAEDHDEPEVALRHRATQQFVAPMSMTPSELKWFVRNLLEELHELVIDGVKKDVGRQKEKKKAADEAAAAAKKAARALLNDTLSPHSALECGERLTSANGRFKLVHQNDGNIVLYDEHGDPHFATNTHFSDEKETKGVGSTDKCKLIFQGDGNLVLYSEENEPLWASNTDGKGGANVLLRNDRNLVILSEEGETVWSSKSAIVPPTNGVFEAGDQLIRGASTENSTFKLVHQNDGNVVLFSKTDNNVSGVVDGESGEQQTQQFTSEWSTATNGKDTTHFVFQSDGNLVLYNGSDEVVWSSSTNGQGGVKFNVQGDGNMVIYTEDGGAIWASKSAPSAVEAKKAEDDDNIPDFTKLKATAERNFARAVCDAVGLLTNRTMHNATDESFQRSFGAANVDSPVEQIVLKPARNASREEKRKQLEEERSARPWDIAEEDNSNLEEGFVDAQGEAHTTSTLPEAEQQPRFVHVDEQREVDHLTPDELPLWMLFSSRTVARLLLCALHHSFCGPLGASFSIPEGVLKARFCGYAPNSNSNTTSLYRCVPCLSNAPLAISYHDLCRLGGVTPTEFAALYAVFLSLVPYPLERNGCTLELKSHNVLQRFRNRRAAQLRREARKVHAIGKGLPTPEHAETEKASDNDADEGVDVARSEDEEQQLTYRGMSDSDVNEVVKRRKAFIQQLLKVSSGQQ